MSNTAGPNGASQGTTAGVLLLLPSLLRLPVPSPSLPASLPDPIRGTLTPLWLACISQTAPRGSACHSDATLFAVSYSLTPLGKRRWHPFPLVSFPSHTSLPLWPMSSTPSHSGATPGDLSQGSIHFQSQVSSGSHPQGQVSEPGGLT